MSPLDQHNHLSPHSATANTEARAFDNALQLFNEASLRVPAYKDFLKKNNVDARSITTAAAFKTLPSISKENYFSQYRPEELCWDGSFTSSQYVSTSSGSSGKPFFWPRGSIHDRSVGAVFQNIFEEIFNTKEGSTLCIISLAFGQWIAGFEFYNAICKTRDAGNTITLVTSGIESTDVINKVSTLGHLYDRIVIAGYPPFIKDLIELGIEKDINWKAKELHLLTAGEPFTEKWRSYVLSLVSERATIHGVNNIYGMSEVGLVAHETPKSILLRHFLDAEAYATVPNTEVVSSLYQYYATERYFEVKGDHSLLLTANADFPLIRYETRDLGGVFRFEQLPAAVQQKTEALAKEQAVDMEKWQLPFVYLFGRKDFSVTLYALNVYTENVKMAFDDAKLNDTLSGLFTMEVVQDAHLDQILQITIELDRNYTADSELSKVITDALVKGLCKYNSEYAKLYSSLGTRAVPEVVLVPYGTLETIRGKKHKWVKR